MVMTAYDAAWRTTQLSTIGGSSAAAVVGKSRWTTPAELWGRMKTVIVDGDLPPETRETDDMRRGRLFEGVARELLAHLLYADIQPHDQCRFEMNSDFPWAHCLVDGRVEKAHGRLAAPVEDEDQVVRGGQIVEIKCPRPGTIARCNMEGLLSEWWLQCQHNMMVTGTTVCHLGLLDTMSAVLHYMPVEMDKVAATDLMHAERDFFNSVREGRPPTGDEAHKTDDPGATRDSLTGPEIAQAAQTFFRLREIKADAAESLDIAKARLITLAKGSEAFEVHDPDGQQIGRFYHRLAKPQRTFQHAVAVKDFPQLKADKYWRAKKASRPFRGYPSGG